MALFAPHSVAYAIIIISLVAALGLAIGNIRCCKVNLGIAGVLFSGLLFGHLGITVSREVLEFLREFGLILFVYTIGMQVGPGFFSSLKREGLRLNLLAASVVLLGAGLTVLISRLCAIEMPAAVGIFAGATTNTPSLAAAQQALKDMAAAGEAAAKLPGIGYAVAYPFGILGTILSMLLARLIFRVDFAHEALSDGPSGSPDKVSVMNLEVTNQNLDGLPVSKVPALESLGVRISRIMHEGKVSVAQSDTVMRLGDVLLAVGPKASLSELALVIGRPSDMDLKSLSSGIVSSRVIVTRNEVLGKTLEQLDLADHYGVVITRAARAEIEFVPASNYTLHFGDALQAVGEQAAVSKVASLLGNSPRALNHPQLIPVFVGIALGVLLGQVPFSLPGMPAPVRLGLAGGPLAMAILLSRIRQIGPLSWYMPISANFMLRELGIILFLSCVGLRAGDQFFSTLRHGHGLQWMACGALVTFLPLAIVAVVARLKYRLNYFSLCGLLAGSMTDPPALSFANSLSPCSATSIAYATVYPLVMLLRVLCAQILVLSSF
ncbi:MAG TPA: putative transporter [Elusimicrobia bacterium]|nr:putative transporter [Elusimicrobiota bacterium]HBT62166.1 putative transporter [Elusimicrobiota bacterium]